MFLLTPQASKPTTELFAFYRDCDPEPNPPCWTTATITATLDYLTRGHGDHIKSLVSLLSRTQVLDP